MKVKDLKNLLNQVPDDIEVWVSDAYEGNDYHGNFEVKVLDGVDGNKYAEIEIGGLLVN